MGWRQQGRVTLNHAAGSHASRSLRRVHSRSAIVSDRGSEFWLCRKGLTDPEFAKYPKLPVTRCGGYEAVEKAGGELPSSERSGRVSGHYQPAPRVWV